MIVDYGVFVEPPVIINQYILLPSLLGRGRGWFFFLLLLLHFLLYLHHFNGEDEC